MAWQSGQSPKGTASPADPRSNPVLIRTYQIASLSCAVILLLYSVAGIAGWIIDVDWLKHPFALHPSPQSATVVAFLLASITLGGFCFKLENKLWRAFAATIGVAIALTGALNMLEHTLQLDWNLAQPLFHFTESKPLTFPGPIAPDVAFMFILLGTAIFARSIEPERLLIHSQIWALMVALPNFMILCCYAGGAPHMCAYFGCLRFSAVTAVLFSLSCFAFLFAAPERGIANLFTRESFGGRLVRAILLSLLCFTPILCAINAGQAAGIYDQPVALALITIVLVSLLGSCIWFAARKIDRIEAAAAEAVLAQSKKFKSICLQCAREFESDLGLARCPDDDSELTQVVDDIPIGSIFDGRCKVLSLLGKGGNSAVYLVQCNRTGANLALKVLRQHLASDPVSMQRFRREAESTATLNHQNILSTQEFGISSGGQAFIIMDYLKGASLFHLLERKNTLSWLEAVPIFIQICDGLSYAHDHGIVHRDLKPSNIMIAHDTAGSASVKIVDFGIARPTLVEPAKKLTQTGEVLGTPWYMSPEQCRGEPLDGRSDLYAMGCLMYETLCGQPPIAGENAYEVIYGHLTDQPAPFPLHVTMPQWLSRIIFQSLSKEREQRQQSAAEMSLALRAGMQAATRPQV